MTTTATRRDSDLYPVEDQYFFNTGDCLQYRHNGHTYFRRLYAVDPAAWKWDLGDDFEVPAGWTLKATGSRFGHHCYILVKTVGHTPTSVTGGCQRGFRTAFCFVQELLDGDISLATADRGVVVTDYFNR
jgi:hypothetical protein